MAYAWSPIKYGGEPSAVPNAQATDVKVAEYGEEVDAGKLGISDEDFQDLLDSGAVREEAPPEDVPAGMSVRDFLRQQAQEAGEAYETTGGTLMLSEVEQAAVAKAAQAEVANAEEVEPEETDAESARLARMPILADSEGSGSSGGSSSSSSSSSTADKAEGS
jgi:hypothetical protein